MPPLPPCFQQPCAKYLPLDLFLSEGNEEEDENILDRAEIEDEEEEEMETYVTQRVEQEFDFKTFVQRFAVQSVCTAYAIIFNSYAKNTDHTNHCIIKMFHRIGKPNF